MGVTIDVGDETVVAVVCDQPITGEETALRLIFWAGKLKGHDLLGD